MTTSFKFPSLALLRQIWKRLTQTIPWTNMLMIPTWLCLPQNPMPYRQNWIMSPSGQKRIISHSMCSKAVRWLFADHVWQSMIQTSPSPTRSATCEWTQNSRGIHVGQIRIYPSHKLHLNCRCSVHVYPKSPPSAWADRSQTRGSDQGNGCR